MKNRSKNSRVANSAARSRRRTRARVGRWLGTVGFTASLLATFACNGVELVSVSDTPTFRGITIPIPPPAIIEEPIIRVDIEGQLPADAGSPGTEVLLYEKVSDRGYFVFADGQDYIFYDVLVDVTDNCMWTYYIEGGVDGEPSAKAYYKMELRDANEEPEACDADECSETDEQNMCVCLVQWNSGC